MKKQNKKTLYKIISDLLDADPIEIITWLLTMLGLLAIGITIAYGTYYIIN
jgi:hypothetical protein